MPQAERFGIYLNLKELKTVRITSPYWLPEPPDWIYVTDKVNATLLEIRGLIEEKSLAPDAGSVTWGRIPLKD